MFDCKKIYGTHNLNSRSNPVRWPVHNISFRNNQPALSFATSLKRLWSDSRMLDFIKTVRSVIS